MVKKLVSGAILVPLAQIWAPKIFLWILPLLDFLPLYTLFYKEYFFFQLSLSAA